MWWKWILFFILIMAIFTHLLIFWIMVFLKRKKSKSNYGLLVLNIDWKDKKMVRESDDCFSQFLPLDLGKNKIKKNIYTSVDSFLNLLEVNTKENVINYFNNPSSHRYNCNFRFAKNHNNNENYKNPWHNREYLLKIFHKGDNNFWCTIKYSHNTKILKKDVYRELNNPQDLKNLPYKYYYAYCINISSLLYTETFSMREIYLNIYKFLNINPKHTYLLIDEGIAYIILGVNSLYLMRKKTKIAYKNLLEPTKKLEFNKFINSYSILEWNKINNNDEVTKVLNKARFLNYHLWNKFPKNKYGYWALDDFSLKNEFDKFFVTLEEFETKNKNKDFIKEIVPVNYVGNNETKDLKINVAKIYINGFSVEKFKFFLNIPWYVTKYQNLWNDYLLENNSNSSDARFLIHNYHLNIETLTLYEATNVSFIISEFKNNFDYKLLFKLKLKLDSEKSDLGLYVEKVTPELLNFVKYLKTNNIFVISQKITQNLDINSESYLEMINLKNSINEKSIIIYEGLPEKIDNIIKQELEINYVIENFNDNV